MSMIGLVTPRHTLAEIQKNPAAPWWIKRHFKDVEEHLTNTLFKGKPLIDQPMTSAACEAVLEEAVEVVRKPKSIDQLMAEFNRSMGRVGPL